MHRREDGGIDLLVGLNKVNKHISQAVHLMALCPHGSHRCTSVFSSFVFVCLPTGSTWLGWETSEYFHNQMFKTCFW